MTYLQKLRKEYPAWEKYDDDYIIRNSCPKLFFKCRNLSKICEQHRSIKVAWDIELCRKCWNMEAQE